MNAFTFSISTGPDGHSAGGANAPRDRVFQMPVNTKNQKKHEVVDTKTAEGCQFF